MSGETNDVTMHGYPPIPSEIPTTKDGWRQRAIGLKLRLSAAESQNQALQEEVDRLRHVVRHESPDMISCSCGATRHGIAVENQALQERAEKAEARLQLAEDALAMYQAGAVTHISIESRPTQETDPE